MKAHYLALCGGVGGAKLALGLSRSLDPDQLTIVVNTGDDFQHLGLAISPDIDTVVYTLAGLADRERGWGVAGETWQFMDALRRLGGADWFQLGDRDLAMHVERSRMLREGNSLSEVTAELARALGVAPQIVPMSDEPAATNIVTAEGVMTFQQYFVKSGCEPRVVEVDLAEASRAQPSRAFLEALGRPDLQGIIICPSNPYLSIDPILALDGVSPRLASTAVPIIAVSPIIAGQAVKGPTAKIMTELGVEPDAVQVVSYYRDIIDGFLLDEQDAQRTRDIEAYGVIVRRAQTLMTDDESREGLARTAVDFCQSLANAGELT